MKKELIRPAVPTANKTTTKKPFIWREEGREWEGSMPKMLANRPKRKQQTANVVAEKKDPCGLCRHGLQKQVMKHGVSLN